MSTVISNDKHYKALGLKIRKVLATTIEYRPSEMPQAIKRIPNESEDFSVITRGAVFSGNTAKMIGTRMYPSMFSGSDVDTFEIPESITDIPRCVFYGSKLKNIIIPSNVTSIGYSCFRYCAGLTAVEIHNSSISIGNRAFWNCDLLETLIFRDTTKVCSVSDADDIISTGLLGYGDGYIYVPSELLESYKAETGWSKYSSQFRALEDYTVDGTVTGEFDYSKI